MKKSALLLSIGGTIISLVFSYLAISGEITGKTYFYDEHANPRSRRHTGKFISVSHNSSPIEFRRGNNFFWAVAGFGFVAAGIGIYFFREIDKFE